MELNNANSLIAKNNDFEVKVEKDGSFTINTRSFTISVSNREDVDKLIKEEAPEDYWENFRLMLNHLEAARDFYAAQKKFNDATDELRKHIEQIKKERDIIINGSKKT
jgi:hypothetical protein